MAMKCLRSMVSWLRSINSKMNFNFFFFSNRIYAYILDILKGPVESLKTHVQNAKKGNLGKDSYIFRWLGNQFDKFSNNSRQLTEFSKEVTKILQDLVKNIF